MFSGLLCHNALLQGIVQTNVEGRITEKLVLAGSIQCRIAAPTPSYKSVFGSEFTDKIDALVYCDYRKDEEQEHDLGNLPYPNISYLNWSKYDIKTMSDISDEYMFLLLSTSAEGFAGDYKVVTPFKLCVSYSEIHHIEFGISKVST